MNIFIKVVTVTFPIACLEVAVGDACSCAYSIEVRRANQRSKARVCKRKKAIHIVTVSIPIQGFGLSRLRSRNPRSCKRRGFQGRLFNRVNRRSTELEMKN